MFFSEKSRQELSIMQRFIREFTDFPKGKLVKSESPDFILKHNIRNALGIELTRLRPAVNEKISYESQHIELSKEILEGTILAKEEKLSIYRKKRLSQIWLIITGVQSTGATRFNVSNKLQNWSFSSDFDRIFLFDVGDLHIYELNISG